VKGSEVLFAGEPGIGKSTLLIQLASSITEEKKKEVGESSGGAGAQSDVVYISEEENREQIAARARRLGLQLKGISLICDTDCDAAG
jgi:DNA repair protein RadA/Sms